MTEHPLSIVQCPECALVYTSPRPDPMLGHDYFESAYGADAKLADHPYYHDHDALVTKFGEKVDVVDTLSVTNRRLLDVGAGQGHFVKAARDAGWLADGVELSAAARHTAKQRFDIAFLDQMPVAPAQYDVVTLWDVIEHLDDPHGMLRQIWALLTPGGYVAITTGNIDSLNFHLCPAEWDLWHVDHRFYYSPDTLDFVLKQCGYNHRRLLPPPNADNNDSNRRNRRLLRTLKQMLRSPIRSWQRHCLTQQLAGPKHDYLITHIAQRPS